VALSEIAMLVHGVCKKAINTRITAINEAITKYNVKFFILFSFLEVLKDKLFYRFGKKQL
jgi:hypothetical protein